MVYYLSILESLFKQVWYWPTVVAFALLANHFLKARVKANISVQSRETNSWWLLLWGLVIFAVFSAAYWILRENAPHCFSDDTSMTLQTYLSASRRGDSINWTNGLLGGMDRWLLPNCHPLSLGRIYALFLHQPYQLYLFIMGINVVLVFIFTWKIQTELWRMRPWAAALGSVIAVIVQGYWVGLYPDAHISNGHGFLVIIVGVYWLTRYCQHRKFWMVALLVGAAMAVGSWIPFHNLPPLLVTVAIWGLVFWGKNSWKKVLTVNFVILLVFLAVLFPYFLAIKSLFATTGRSEVFRPTVNLSGIYLWPQILVLSALVALGTILKLYRQKEVREVFLMFLGFCLMPLLAYALETIKIMPSFRWQLLYAGNDAWGWMAIVFLLERIQREIQNRWVMGGLTCKFIVLSAGWTIIVFAWMNSLWLDLISSYPTGNWKSLTDSSVSSILKTLEPKPVRVVGIDDTNDTHFWGQYQGLEPMLGYVPFIDRRKTQFWWYSAMLESLHGAYSAAFLSIPVPIQGHEWNLNFPIPLSKLVNLDALRVANVHWIVSRHPLYPMEGLQIIVNQPGKSPACNPSSSTLTQIDFKIVQKYWQDVGCMMKDYAYERPFYAYHIEGALPRVYLASALIPWPQGQPQVLSQTELLGAVGKVAFVDAKQWKAYQASQGSVEIDNYQSDYMRVRLDVPKESLVVVSSTLNSYWRVLVDGKKVETFDVNGIHTGFWVPANAHQGELVYCPPFRPAKHPGCFKRF